MGDTRIPEAPPGLVSGRLEGISVPDLLWTVCRQKKTGVLHLRREDVHKTVYVQDGQVIFATSSHGDDRLGELLLRDGVISLDELEQSLDRLHTGKRLGTLLVEAGHLSPDELVRGVLTQVQRTVLRLFTWESGDYYFDEGPLPTDEVITLGLRTGEILLQGIRCIRSFTRVRRTVGPPRTFYRTAPNWREAVEGLGLSDGEMTLVEHLSEGGDTVQNLCQEVFLSNFEIYQTLWAMKVLGVVEESEHPIDVSGEASVEGAVDSRGVAPVLVRLCRAGETGVLYVTKGSRERTIHIREGQCVFATSTDIEDGLLAHLLRRGVISLRDREETAKRLLSNKRVGTILREIGVIDDEDLQVMVREQLSEIIYDTLGWQEGDYTFVAGELPTIEEITLDASLESLVAEGLRRVSSWSQVVGGSGGPGVRLALTPTYLEILDRMRVGTEEWEMVSRLKHAQEVNEICQSSELGDFRARQTLWILRTVGAVGECADGPDEAVETVVAADESLVEEAGTSLAESSEPPEGWAAVNDSGSGAPSLDSPGDVTTYIPREQIEAVLNAGRGKATPPFEVAEPGSYPPIGEHDEPEAGAESALEEDLDDTMDVPRGDVEAALAPELSDAVEAAAEGAEDRADETPPPVDPDWDPPADIDRDIARLNARQRVLFRTIRAEVGAGAGNFIRSCAGKLGSEGRQPFTGAALRADGSWDVEGLRRAACHHQVSDPWSEYERLIEVEIEMLRTHIGEARMEALRRQVETAGEPAQTARPPE